MTVVLPLGAQEPLTERDSVRVASRDAHRVQPSVMAMGIVSAATWTQVLGVPEGWPRTWRGYGYRVGDQVGFALSEEVVHAGLRAVIPWHATADACPAARAGAWRARAQGAARCGLQRTFVARNDAGAARPNAPLLGAIVTASAVSLAWRPERKNAHKGQLFVLSRIGIVTGATVLNRSIKAWRGR